MHSKLCTHFTHCISLLLCLPAFVFRTASRFFLDYFVHFRQLAYFSGVMLPAAACLRAAATRASLRPLSTSAVLQQQQTGQTGEKKPKRNSSNISLAVSNFGILKSSICSHTHTHTTYLENSSYFYDEIVLTGREKINELSKRVMGELSKGPK